jgi:hypothetical protein
MNTAVPLRSLRPVDYGKSYNKLKSTFDLSPDENDLLQKMKEIKHPTDDRELSMYGQMIKNVIADFTIERFRNTVTTLLSQAYDNETTIELIIGRRCLQALKKLKP